jgi:hypothetical protein|tara:strand:+ start:1934 stop:2302 length:369 start_codon:yes stop_codon:yes gene_type:complete
MEFFINKNSTLPYLKMELVNDGRNDFRKFYEKIQNATIKFNMYDTSTKVKIIAKADATIELKCETCGIGGDEPEYYIVYKWSDRDTRRVGQYNGEFTITFLGGDGTLIAPIREELFINVIDN